MRERARGEGDKRGEKRGKELRYRLEKEKKKEISLCFFI